MHHPPRESACSGGTSSPGIQKCLSTPTHLWHPGHWDVWSAFSSSTGMSSSAAGSVEWLPLGCSLFTKAAGETAPPRPLPLPRARLPGEGPTGWRGGDADAILFAWESKNLPCICNLWGFPDSPSFQLAFASAIGAVGSSLGSSRVPKGIKLLPFGVPWRAPANFPCKAPSGNSKVSNKHRH